MGVHETGGGPMTTALRGKIDAALAPITDWVAPTRPSLRSVTSKVMDESGVSYKEARAFVESMRQGIADTLAHGGTRWFMPEQWLQRHHHILEAIAPDGQRSTPGSAHAAVEHYVLDPSKGQLGLIHGKHERTWRRDGQLHCTMDVCIEAVAIP